VGKQHEKKRNRSRNAGGVPLDAYKTSLSIANALNELRPKTRGVVPLPTTELNLFHLYFLYLWLTDRLVDLDDAKALPDLTLVSGSADCAPNCLRRIRESGISWIEYAQPYALKKGVEYLWQPFPQAVNSLFSYWLTHCDTTLRLTKLEKDRLFWQLKQRKWRTPDALKCQHMLRKDTMFGYIAHQAKIDPYLSSPARALVINTLHHRCALSYQKLNSNQIRYEIFCAHNRYLARLSRAMNTTEIKPLFDLRLPKSQALVPLFSSPRALPAYLKTSGNIVAFKLHVSAGARTYVPILPISFGSKRALDVADLSTFFAFLRQRLQAAPNDSTFHQDALRQYYNQRTFELALLFVLLTGTRPTHHISIEKSYCFDLRRALVKDKGRYRQIEICRYLKDAIRDYQKLQQRVIKRLNIDTRSTNTLWYLINNANHTELLSAKTLRHFMAKNWAACFDSTSPTSRRNAVVPYQLRHSFAQHALMATRPKLSSQHIDLLMGHSEAGEHLGQGYQFSACHRLLLEHLKQWPDLLKLTAFRPPQATKEAFYE
jgi:integrase